MAEAEEEIKPQPIQTLADIHAYHAELRKELGDLEFAQSMVWSEYKQRRIVILKGRLGIPVD